MPEGQVIKIMISAIPAVTNLEYELPFKDICGNSFDFSDKRIGRICSGRVRISTCTFFSGSDWEDAYRPDEEVHEQGTKIVELRERGP